MSVTINGSTGVTTPGISNSEGYTGDGLTIAAGASSGAVQVDTSGNLGLGVTPSAWGLLKGFDISSSGALFGYTAQAGISNNAYFDGSDWRYKNTAAASFFRANAGAFEWHTAPSGTAGSAISFTQAMTLDSSGRLLLGTTSGSTNVFFRSGDTSNPAFIVRNGNTSGNTFGINANFNGSAPNNTTSFFLQCNDTGAERATIRSNGGLANYQGNNVNLSDRREKTNFAPAKSYLETICAIPVQTFNYIDQNLEEDPGLTLGVVAQDVQEVAPELVMESNWGSKEEPKMRLSIYQTDLQYALMKAIQELKAINDAQAQTITAQQAALESLTARVVALEGAQIV